MNYIVLVHGGYSILNFIIYRNRHLDFMLIKNNKIQWMIQCNLKALNFHTIVHPFIIFFVAI